MKLPGITHISYILCSELPSCIAITHLCGVPVGLSVSPVSICFLGTPECEAESEVENNGRREKVTLTFRTLDEIPLEHPLAFLITAASGESYIIGTREDMPTAQITTLTGTPSDESAGFSIEVSLTALKALVPVSA